MPLEHWRRINPAGALRSCIGSIKARKARWFAATSTFDVVVVPMLIGSRTIVTVVRLRTTISNVESVWTAT